MTRRFGAAQSGGGMTEFDDLQTRIAHALDRVAGGLEALRRAAPGTQVAHLEAQLAEERANAAGLIERARRLRDRNAETEARLSQQVERLMERVENQDGQLERMRALNAQLRELNAELRDRNAAGEAAPDLLERGLAAELASLRELRASEAQEIDDILSELRPLVEEVQNA